MSKMAQTSFISSQGSLGQWGTPDPSWTDQLWIGDGVGMRWRGSFKGYVRKERKWLEGLKMDFMCLSSINLETLSPFYRRIKRIRDI